jgi:hypothetical protein
LLRRWLSQRRLRRLATQERKARARAGRFDPEGKIDTPIGIANSMDALKTFVEGDGC